MKFVLELTLGNDAMQTAQDVSDALRRVAFRLDHVEDINTLADCSKVKDINGNTVGFFKVDEE